MRVVIAGDFPADPPNIVGGIQAVIYNTLEHLARYSDLDIHVISCEKWWKNIPQTPVSGPGWTAHYLPSSPRIPHTISMMTVDRWNLARTIRALAPDLVHAHGQAAAYPWAAYDSRLPTILTVHGITYLEARLDQRGGAWRSHARAWLWERAEKACIHRATDIVVISPFVANLIRPYTNARFNRIENPVGSDLFDLIRSEVIPGRVLFVGTVKRCKGLTDLITAVHSLRELDPKVHLRVAGGFTTVNAAYGAEVRRLVASLQMEERVEFLGQLDRASLLEEYDRCAVFCLPSYLEASPVVVAEAMSAGCPVVTTTIDSTAHLVSSGNTGRRVPPGDVQALAETLRILLINPELQYNVGGAARKVALERFHATKAADATYQLYGKVLAAGQ